MKYKKVILLNGTFSGSQHEMIDSSLIISFAQFTERIKVYFLPKRRNIIKKLVSKRLDSKDVEYHCLYNVPDKVRITFRELIAAIQECFIFVFVDVHVTVIVSYVPKYHHSSI